jgi:hypothetical protein
MQSTQTVPKGCEDTHARHRDCTGQPRWIAVWHGYEKRLCDPAAARLRKRMMEGALCPKCLKPKAWEWDLVEVKA